MASAHNEAGESLVEILAAVAVISIGLVGLLTALGTHATTTVVNRNQAQAGTLLLAAAEYVKAQPFTACGPVAATTVNATQLPHDPAFTITYGPGRQVEAGTPCADLTAVPVRVSGEGFNLAAEVVKRP